MSNPTSRRMSRWAMVIINYNTREHLRHCLDSIYANSANGVPADANGNAVEIIVVDNNSRDGSAALVREHFPQATLYANTANTGYGAAANQAIAACDADVVLLLNSDTLLQRDTVASLQRYMDAHPDAAVVGPRLHNADNSLQPSCYPYPTPLNLFWEESLLSRLAVQLPGVRERYLRTWAHDAARSVPWVLGAVLAIRRAPFLAVGGFDPAFFMYFEEIDLCYRLYMQGWEIHFAPVTTVIHAGGASTSQQPAKMQQRLFRSTQVFYARHYGAGQWRLLRLLMLPIFALRLGREAMRYGAAREPQARSHAREMVQMRYRVLRECLAARAPTPAAGANL